MNQSTINTIKSFGFKVYMRHVSDGWCIYSNGTEIALYNEDEKIYSIHYDNKWTGTGFLMAKGLSKENLLRGFCLCPSWFIYSQASIRKYRSIEEYKKENSFNMVYKEI
jgi:hypothetical protein